MYIRALGKRTYEKVLTVCFDYFSTCVDCNISYPFDVTM